MTTRKTYSAEFKRDAVQIPHTTNSVSGTAHDLGIGLSAPRKWKHAAQEEGDRAFPGQGRPHLTADQQEIKRPRQENDILRQEREIPNKAAACLGQNSTRMGLGRFFAKELTR